MSIQMNQGSNYFIGKLDTDSDQHIVAKGDYVYALNIRNGKGAIEGVATNVKGNKKVNFTLPSGTNICIGTLEDKHTDSILYFIYNDDRNHCILQYFPEKIANDPNGEIQLVMRTSELNFSEKWLIHSSALIDGKLLYWTDALSFGLDIEGNPPRKINTSKANITGKQLTIGAIS